MHQCHERCVFGTYVDYTGVYLGEIGLTEQFTAYVKSEEA